jgi:hypothetical protein
MLLCFTARRIIRFMNLVNSDIGYYHVYCFESLVDVSSLDHAERFTAGGQKFAADRGAECLTAEVISRRKQKLRAQEYQNLDSSGAVSLENPIKKEESAEGPNVWAAEEAWQVLV